MKISANIDCTDFPCNDVRIENFSLPNIYVDPDHIRMIMISEAPSIHKNKNFYKKDNHQDMQDTVQIFIDAGLGISRPIF